MARSKTRVGEEIAQKASRIPTFHSIEEEAEFWDTHDLTEFEDELEPVTDVSFGSIQSKNQLVLRITGEDLAALVARAQEQGVYPAELVRRWIREKLGTDTVVNNHHAR